MIFRKIFDDKTSKDLYKQIRETQTYLYKELDKSITKKLILRVLEMDLLPVLVYPERELNIMPMHYSRIRDEQVNIHTPIPDVRLFTLEEWCTVPKVMDRTRYPDLSVWRKEQEEDFKIALKHMKEMVTKLDG